MGDVRFGPGTPFLNGVAYSPHYGFDFGEDVQVELNGRPEVTRDGLHHPDRATQVWKDFAELARNGIHAVRMQVFADGRTGISFAPNDPGHAMSVQQTVFQGLSNVLAAAKANGIYVHFVLFDHLFTYTAKPFDETNQTDSKKIQGHLGAFATAANRQILFDNVIQPVLASLGRDANVSNLLSLELINEPELIIQGMHGNQEAGILASEKRPFVDYLKRVGDLVHQLTGAQFTVGALGIGTKKEWKEWLRALDSKRDYLSIHYYSQHANGDPDFSDFYGEDGFAPLLRSGFPVVIGEYAANGSQDFPNSKPPQGFKTATEFLEQLLRKRGVAGAFAWQMYSGDGKHNPGEYGKIPLEQHRRFALNHPKQVAHGQPSFRPPATRRLLQPQPFGTQPNPPVPRPPKPQQGPRSAPLNAPKNPLNDPRNPISPLNMGRIMRENQGMWDRIRKRGEETLKRLDEIRKRSQEAFSKIPIASAPPMRSWSTTGSVPRHGEVRKTATPPFTSLSAANAPHSSGPPTILRTPPDRQTWRDIHKPSSWTGGGGSSSPINWGNIRTIQDAGRVLRESTPPPRRDHAGGKHGGVAQPYQTIVVDRG